ncbi:MAG: hypothetical protein EKK30_07390 [Hyphomicrobium sp.]|nr:MAG: hypothetical protein EKK30_07390 [Hyphomicrobium sp.]
MKWDNVIWVDFRLSKDIRDKQVLSFAERMRESSARTQRHLQASRSALEVIRRTWERDPFSPGRGR